MPDDRYAALVAQAEKAVASVKEQIAFQKVLDDLLGANEQKPHTARRSVIRKSQPDKTRGSARGAQRNTYRS